MKSPTETLAIRSLSSERVWDYENGFYWFSQPNRLGKAIAQYELYKRITGLPGHVVECGVYKAASLIRLATYRSILESPHSRSIIAFDAFGAFPASGADKLDSEFIARFEKEGGSGLASAEVTALLERKNLLENVMLVEGDVRQTITAFLMKRPEFRIALLHLDMDVYEPTKFALDHLADRVVRGGLVMIDDYNGVVGATVAVEEFLSAHPSLQIQKLSCAPVPAFVVV